MILNIGTSITTKKLAVQKTSKPAAISAIIATTIFTISSAYAVPETAGNTTAIGDTTMVKPTSDSVIQATTAPKHVVSQNINDTIITQGSTTVTRVPVTNQSNKTVTNVQVITTPLNNVKQVLPVAPATQLPVMNESTTTQILTTPSTLNQSVISPTFTDQTVKSNSLETFQLTPTFSKPDMVSAQTKIMKILKNEEGQELALPTNHVTSGDIIEYHTTYTNSTDQPVNNINVLVSLPDSIQLVSLNSLLPTLATTDGENYQTIQPMSNTVATQENYSGLKWDLVHLDASATQTVVIRAKVQ
ncbi:hypothetical protein [Psychrobacter sp. AOP7-B1-24]|uniref:hypothetical protein n=1 Tax=Psychrobacter sp. AOP7-B1-24 TaxID=3457645 RepID=UPI00402B75E6